MKRIMIGSKRRSCLGLGVADWRGSSLGSIDSVCHPSNSPVFNEFLGTGEISCKDLWKMQRRSKSMLAMRTVAAGATLIEKLERRRTWNRANRAVETLLDLFPSLKYSYSSLLPKSSRRGYVEVLRTADTGRVSTRVGDIARSYNIRLDPIDSPKRLIEYAWRIQSIINWCYKQGFVPVMMTLTLYHRWHALAPLCRILRQAWSRLFGGGKAGVARKKYIDLQGYIRRMEETINDGDGGVPVDNGGGEDKSFNAGWHPHYHIVLMVPREKLQVLSDYEERLREIWVELVRKYYVDEFGEDIPASYHEAFKQHGLVFSRYKSAEHARACGCRHGKAGDLFEVKDGKYLAKMLGYDASEVYGIESELTAQRAKRSKAPFDLLCEEVTAGSVELWCEYAIATKGMPCFSFSHGLEQEVKAYYEAHPDEKLAEYVLPKQAPEEFVVLRLRSEDFHWLYRHFQLGELLAKSKGERAAVIAWLEENFGFEVVELDEEGAIVSTAAAGRTEDEPSVRDESATGERAGADSAEGNASDLTQPLVERWARTDFSRKNQPVVEFELSDEDISPQKSITAEEEALIRKMHEELQQFMKAHLEKRDAAPSQPVSPKPSAPPPVPPPPTAEELRKAHEEIENFFKSHGSIPPAPPPAEQRYEKASAADKGIRAPISQAPASQPDWEKTRLRDEELKIAKKLDDSVGLRFGIRFTPLVQKGLSANEVVQQQSLTIWEKDEILQVILRLRKKISKRRKAPRDKFDAQMILPGFE